MAFDLFPLFFHCDYLTGNYIFISTILCCVYLIVLLFSLIGLCFLFPNSAMSFLFLYLLWTCAIMFLLRLSMVQHTYMESALVPWLIFSYSELINVFCMFLFCCYFHRNNSIEAVVSVYLHFTWSALLRVFIYSWCLNNIGLNCMCLFKHGFFPLSSKYFSVVVQLHYLRLVKYVDPWKQRNAEHRWLTTSCTRTAHRAEGRRP